jgi:LmbE family N-acetylglucosaminyl deacetylase
VRGDVTGGSVLSFNSSSRLLIFAPHPDDESLACGVLLQNAVLAGAAVLVVYVTDGENNPWPQRFLSRRWKLNAAARQRWAKLRRREALAALRVLGVSPEDARFLAWPDQGLTGMLKSQPELVLARLRYLIREWCPTDIVAPDVRDRHPDHSAVGRMLERLFSGGLFLEEVRRWSYVVHGRAGGFRAEAQALSQTEAQTEAKRRAIGCHRSQLMLSRRRFLGYAVGPELVLNVQPAGANQTQPSCAVWEIPADVACDA